MKNNGVLVYRFDFGYGGKLNDLRPPRLYSINEFKKELNVYSFNMNERKKTYKGLIHYLTKTLGLLSGEKIIYIDNYQIAVIKK